MPELGALHFAYAGCFARRAQALRFDEPVATPGVVRERGGGADVLETVMPEGYVQVSGDRGKAVNLLIVDDDEVDQMAIQRAFRKQKIANPLFAARNGIEGLEMLRGANGRAAIPKPYIILLDLKMPKMTGLEFLEALRKDPCHRHAIVFVLTTSRDEQDRFRAYDQHVAGYIVKSNVSKDFLELIGLLDHYWKVVELPDWEDASCVLR